MDAYSLQRSTCQAGIVEHLAISLVISGNNIGGLQEGRAFKMDGWKGL